MPDGIASTERFSVNFQEPFPMRHSSSAWMPFVALAALLLLQKAAPRRRTQSLVAALQALARLAGLERGCLEAHVLTESNDPRHLYYSEAWDAEENLRSMLRSERFTHLVALMELAAEPPVLDFRAISAICGLEFARQARHDHE
jgi:quinol monooxygenase YgiN